MSTRGQILMLPMLFCALMAGATQAQDADDYRGALAMAKRDGCTTASIPYPDYRDTAERKQADVTRWCKEAPRGCEGLETKALLATVEGIPRDIESLSRDRDSLRSRRSSSTDDSEKSSIDSNISELERKIEERNKALEFAKRSLETDRSDADKRIYNGKYCVQAREDVQDPFRSAGSRAQDAGNRDSTLKPFTDDLRNIWQQCEQDHQKDVRAAKDAIEYCQKAKDGAI